MSSPIKIFLAVLFLFGSQFAFSQENPETSPTKEKKQAFHIQLGAFQPMAIGSNSMASDAMDQKLGMSFSAMLRIFDSNFLVGVDIQSFKSMVKSDKIPKVGNYYKSWSHRQSVKVGYVFWENSSDWMAYATVGLGNVTYKNLSEDFKFRDTGTSVELGPTLSYNFHRHFAVYGTATYRKDFLKTKTPPAIKNYFKHQEYLTFGLGIKASF